MVFRKEAFGIFHFVPFVEKAAGPATGSERGPLARRVIIGYNSRYGFRKIIQISY